MELTRSTYLLSCYVSTYSRGGKLTDYDAAKVACAAGASIADVYTAAVLHFDTDPYGRGWVLTLNGRDAQMVEAIGSPRERVPSHLGYQPPAWVVASARRHARAAGVRLPTRGGWAQTGRRAWTADV